ncbi:hypothetical protein ACJRO7_002160 [Eucalyptus globulus]|uniref:Uncharacterized protein n=1 Tax=Eucalyptus globulus TaxID=34317 RepID=A0ABD3LUG6_EUCGL
MESIVKCSLAFSFEIVTTSPRGKERGEKINKINADCLPETEARGKRSNAKEGRKEERDSRETPAMASTGNVSNVVAAATAAAAMVMSCGGDGARGGDRLTRRDEGGGGGRG